MDPEDLQRLVTQKMPYGKYKDRLIADLPGHYLAWFAREGFPAGQLGRLLALMHEIDHNNLRLNQMEPPVRLVPSRWRAAINAVLKPTSIKTVLRSVTIATARLNLYGNRPLPS